MKQFILNALILWSTSLVPFLLPIMIISRLLISTDLLYRLLRPFSFLCNRLLHLSSGGSYALLLGYLCGYPMGVKTLADLRSDGTISLEEARYLAGFINNVSPGFLIACVCHDLLKAPGFVVPCIVMVYGAPLCYGVGMQAVNGHSWEIAGVPDRFDASSGKKHSPNGIVHFEQTHISEAAHMYSNISSDKTCFEQSHISVSKALSTHISFLALLDSAIEDSITQILKICGYMVLFSVLSFFVCHFPWLPALPKAFLSAVLEISLGCKLLAGLSCPLFWKYLLIIMALVFGGLCSAFQSATFLKKIGVPLQKYLKIKAMTAVIALGFCLIYLL